MYLQHQLLLEKAKKKGLSIEDLTEITGSWTAKISNDSREELLLNGTPLSLINLQALVYFDHKQLAKTLFSKLNIPHPKSMLFSDPSAQVVNAFIKPGKKYVCKPPEGTEGIGVELNLKSVHDVQQYWQRNKHLSKVFMLEEQVDGKDLRIQVIGGNIVAACTREPAFGIGDGLQSLESLIEKRKTIIKKQNPANRLVLDQSTFNLLEEQKVSLNTIITKGQKVVLKELANMSQGAVAIDHTEYLPEIYQHWITLICEALNVSYFAADFITNSFTSYHPGKVFLLEVNAKPEWLHHTFSEGKQHDLASILLKDLFDVA